MNEPHPIFPQTTVMSTMTLFPFTHVGCIALLPCGSACFTVHIYHTIPFLPVLPHIPRASHTEQTATFFRCPARTNILKKTLVRIQIFCSQKIYKGAGGTR